MKCEVKMVVLLQDLEEVLTLEVEGKKKLSEGEAKRRERNLE